MSGELWKEVKWNWSFDVLDILMNLSYYSWEVWHYSNVKAFADNVKLTALIFFQNAASSRCTAKLGQHMAQLTISVKKCCILNIGSTVHSPSLSLVNTVLPIKSSVLDLGINININLSPSEHVCRIVARAQKRALAIHRCFTSRDTRLLLRAYISYVQWRRNRGFC